MSRPKKTLNQLDETRMFIRYYVSSIASKKDDILKVFKEDKKNLRTYFNKLSCGFNLAIEYLDDNIFYVSVHFIDDNWELKKKVVYVTDRDDERDWYKKLKCMVECLKLENDICSIVDCDEDTLEDTERCIVSRRDSSLPLAGTFLPLSWLENPFTFKDQWGSKFGGIISEMRKLVQNVRDRKLSSQPPPADIDDDDFKLTEYCVRLKETFSDKEYIDSVNLTRDQWDDATVCYEFWKELINIRNSLHVRKHTTSNVFFPKICHFYMTLLQMEKSGVDYVQEFASDVRETYFDEYWNNSILILAITIVLDPRFKMEFVEWWYMRIYGSDEYEAQVKEVKDKLINVATNYSKRSTFPRPKMLDHMGMPCTSLHHVDDITLVRIEIDRYLAEPRKYAYEGFDILKWWRACSQFYPTLGRMAQDLLAIPFGTRGTLDSSLSKEILNVLTSEELDVDTKEALVHTKVWNYNF